MTERTDEQWVVEIEAMLESDGGCVRYFAESDVDEAERFRSLCRKAGRSLGWKVRTYRHAGWTPGEIAAGVSLIDSNPVHQEALRIRREKLMRQVLETIPPRTVDLRPGPPQR